MALDALAASDVIVYIALVLAAGFVVGRRGRSRDCIDQKGIGELVADEGAESHGCGWKMRVLGVATRGCTIRVSGTPVRVKRGELLLALRPEPRAVASGLAVAEPALGASESSIVSGRGRRPPTPAMQSTSGTADPSPSPSRAGPCGR